MMRKNNMIKLKKDTSCKGDDQTTGDYDSYFKTAYKMTAIYLSKHLSKQSMLILKQYN